MGFLGPGPLRVHVAHAANFLAALPPTLPGAPLGLVDLGSGGGVPGLPLFLARPDAHGVLLDASAKRCAFLLWAVTELGLADRVTVVEGRAEEVAHDDRWRHRFQAAVCRGFGPPPSTVECAAGFVDAGGRIVISEPPERRPWPVKELQRLGLTVRTDYPSVVAFDTMALCAPHRPRPIKQQRRSPLFAF